jgi:hypothetical protein
VRNWALASPPRLVASELAVAARRYGIGTGINASLAKSCHRTGIGIFNVSSTLEGLKEYIEKSLSGIIDEIQLESRYQRRKAKKIKKAINPALVLRSMIPELVEMYGLPQEAFTNLTYSLYLWQDQCVRGQSAFFSGRQTNRLVEIYF